MKRFADSRKGGKKESAWQVTYIDLMTNVMLLFVILWAINHRQATGVSEKLGDETVKMVTLPGDVLFQPGESALSAEGRAVFNRLFADASVLSFDTGGLLKRLLVIHGQTDGDGDKDKNLNLGYERALSAYREIRKYGGEVPDHVVLCTHADNTPAQEVPKMSGVLTPVEEQALRDAKSKNRRITIEDKLVSVTKDAH